jgi:uncharacterized protein
MRSISDTDPVAILLTSAIKTGDIARLKRLLAADPDVATMRIVGSDGFSRTLLHVAADWPGHFPNGAATVATLVAAGADASAAGIPADPSRPRETPLHWAASSDDVAVLDALLDGGADIEAAGAVFTGGTPMSDAVIFAQWNAARRLLERGAQTTIWQAGALGLMDRVEQLYASAPPPADQVTSAFWHACRGGQRETAGFFLDRGANLNWIGYDRKTPLDVARESGATALVSWLQSLGAKPARTTGHQTLH